MHQMFTLDRTVMISKGLTKHKSFWQWTQNFTIVLTKACFGVCIEPAQPLLHLDNSSLKYIFLCHPCQTTVPMQIFMSVALTMPLSLAHSARCLKCSDMFWVNNYSDWSFLLVSTVSSGKCHDITLLSITPQPLPSTSSLIHYSLITLPFSIIQPMLLTVSLNKPQIIKQN